MIVKSLPWYNTVTAKQFTCKMVVLWCIKDSQWILVVAEILGDFFKSSLYIFPHLFLFLQLLEGNLYYWVQDDPKKANLWKQRLSMLLEVFWLLMIWHAESTHKDPRRWTSLLILGVRCSLNNRVALSFLNQFLRMNFYPIDELKSISHCHSNENILGIWREWPWLAHVVFLCESLL